RYRGRLLLGVDVVDPDDFRSGSANAAYLVAPDLRVEAQYTKHHLVPFGEYVPLDLDKLLPIDNLVQGAFKAGKELNLLTLPLQRPGGARSIRLGTEICYD